MRQLSLLLFCISFGTASSMHHSIAAHQPVTVRDVLQLGSFIASKCWYYAASVRANDQNNFQDATAGKWFNHAEYYQTLSEGLPSYHPWYNIALEADLKNPFHVLAIFLAPYIAYKVGKYVYNKIASRGSDECVTLDAEYLKQLHLQATHHQSEARVTVTTKYLNQLREAAQKNNDKNQG